MSTPAAGVGEGFPFLASSRRGHAAEDKIIGTGPVVTDGSKVTVMFTRKLADGRLIGYWPPGERLSFTVGDESMEIGALHTGAKGMAVGGERRIVVPACYALTGEEWEGFFDDSGTDMEAIVEMELLDIE